MRKVKSLHNIIIENCGINTRLSYNLKTNHIGISSIYQYRKEYNKQYYINNKENIDQQVKQYQNNNSRIVFINKRLYTHLPKVKPGYLRHHYIYDHANPSLYIIEMKISDHGKLHKQMRKNGIEIPHINVRINDFRGF